MRWNVSYSFFLRRTDTKHVRLMYAMLNHKNRVSFRLNTSLAQSEAAAAQISSDFLSSLKIFTLAESLGGIESLAE